MRLDVDGAREGNEVNIKLYNSNGNVAQRFYVNNVGNGYFTLRTGCNGYVDLKFGQTSNGSNIWQYEKEAANGEVSVRRQGEGDKGTMKIEEFGKNIAEEVSNMINKW